MPCAHLYVDFGMRSCQGFFFSSVVIGRMRSGAAWVVAFTVLGNDGRVIFRFRQRDLERQRVQPVLDDGEPQSYLQRLPIDR